jgi:hypothetical protein
MVDVQYLPSEERLSTKEQLLDGVCATLVGCILHTPLAALSHFSLTDV